VHEQKWPSFDPAALVKDEIENSGSDKRKGERQDCCTVGSYKRAG